jgi:solute:Na+ symporter, SSS family
MMEPTLVWIGLAIYVAAVFVIALMSRKGLQSELNDYFLARRAMGGVLSALSYGATTYSAFMLVGLAGLTYQGGVGALGFELVYLSGMVLVVYFGPRFWMAGKKFGYVTPSEMLGDRYDSRAVAIVTAVASCLFLIPYSAVQLAGVGYLLSGMSGGAISFTTGALIATVLAVGLTLIAGIRSVAWTDAFQALIMLITSIGVVWVVTQGLGGFDGLFAALERKYPEWLTVPGNGYFSLATFLGLTLPWFFFSISNPQVSQRLFMPSSLVEMRRMLLLFLGYGLIYTLVAILWGFSALVHFPDLENPDLATPTLLSSPLVHPVLGVAVMIGILAAAISTIDSILLTLSSLVARDVYGNIGKGRDAENQLQVGKWVVPVIALLAYGFAELKLDLIAVLSVSSSAGLLVTVPAIIGAFYWKRGTAAGVLSAVVIGGLLVIFLELTKTKPWGLSSGIWGLAVSTLLFVAVSFVTKAPEGKAARFLGEIRKAIREKGAV